MKTNSKSISQHSKDLAKDWGKIKGALSDTAVDVTEIIDDVVTDSCEQIKDKTSGMQKSVTDYTIKKPLPALGVAVLIGFAIGYLFKR